MDKFDHLSGQFIKINDAKIYIEQKGLPSAYPIIFLHGAHIDQKEIVSMTVKQFIEPHSKL